MGMIRPPWVTIEWFRQCPFNYCDHFGDKEKLATVCIICKDEVEWKADCLRKGKDPNDFGEAMKKVGENLSETMVLIHQEADRMGIDLNNLEEMPEPPDLSNHDFIKLADRYRDRVGEMVKLVRSINLVLGPEENLEKLIDSLNHSWGYIGAKLFRALSSEFREMESPIDDLDDSMTSAFFAYIALLRNCETVISVVKSKKFGEFDNTLLRFSEYSLEFAENIRKRFFPKYEMVYEEFGI